MFSHHRQALLALCSFAHFLVIEGMGEYRRTIEEYMRSRRILFLIDCLGLGGAQRQLVNLAIALRQHWQAVDLVSYHDSNATDQYFAQQVADAGIHHELFHADGRLGKLWAFRSILRRRSPAVVIAYLPTPSALAEMAKLTCPTFRLIVSERALSRTPLSRGEKLRLCLHRVADRIVCNSFSQAEAIAAMGLQSRTRVISNQVDTERFCPASLGLPTSNRLRLVTLANYTPNKNVEVVIQGMRLSGLGEHIQHVWWGNPRMPNFGPVPCQAHFQSLEADLQKSGLGSALLLNGICRDPVPEYQASDAFCLPSHSEGSSNALAEALSCGLPVLCSRVSDHPRVIQHGVNGFLFHPGKPQEYADALHQLVALGAEGRDRMSKANRALALSLFSPEAFMEKWNGILGEILP